MKNVKKTMFDKYDKYDEIIDSIVFAQREFFELCGIPNAQVHLSGGLDSSIVAPLVSKAMGKDRTIFITNPSDLNGSSIGYARQTAEKLNIKLWENPIQEIYEKVLEVDEKSFEGQDLNLVGKSTIQALLRTVQGFYNCHRFKSGVVNTGNLVENVLSWYNLGDIGSLGTIQVLGDLTKTELFKLAERINERWEDEIIPENLFNGKFKPAAELPDAQEDPIDYYIQSGLVHEIVRNNKGRTKILNEYLNKELSKEHFPDVNGKSIYDLYSLENFSKELDFTISKYRTSVFKAAMSSPVLLLTPRSRGFSSRETIINKYRG